MKNKLLFFLFILLTIPGITTGAEIRTLGIELSFTASSDPDKQLLGYRLYKESEQVCETTVPSATTITCNVLTETGTFSFTLAGYYSDSSESPQSPPFSFTIDSVPPPAPPILTVESPKSVDEDSSTTITFSATDSDGTIVETTASAEHGSVTVNDTISYVPDSGYNGPDTVSVTTRDDDGLTATATSAVTVNDINDAPTLTVESTKSVDEDSSTTITFSATDSDGTIVETTASSGHGSVIVNGNDTISYVPDSGYYGPDTISVTTKDDDGATATATSAITVNEIIDPPTDPPPADAELRTVDIEFTFDAPDAPGKNLLGYRLYKEVMQVCETTDPNTTTITCEFLTTEGTFNFSLTAYYSDDSESPHSPSFSFTIGALINPEPLQAVVSPASATGEVPLSVSFAATASTGDISSYHWEFGDGTTATGSTANHIYTIAGTYSPTLSIEDSTGTTDQASTTITAQPTVTPPEPPTAILSSSTAAGDAPLTVDFNGTSSTTSNPPIVSYSWTMGDGSQTIGETISYTYSTAGTYHAELTVTDSQGLTDTVDTPIIVVGTAPPNEKPTAVISGDFTPGNAPLAVSFDATQSTDPDGSIAQYSWNFGDGTTENGPTVQHTYTDVAIYTVSLQITDNQGETATATREIVCTTAPPEIIVNFEVGEVSIGHQWVKVLFENSFNQPIVIAGPPTTVNDSDPVLIRIRNIDEEGFAIRLQEWDYQDNDHALETFSYIVIEKGIYTLDSGIKIEAGSFTGSARFQKVSLQQPYDLTPVILTQIMTENEANAVTGRIRKSGESSFDFKLQEQETTKNAHTTETIGYMAWSPGSGELQGLHFETGLTAQTVTHDWFDLTFETTFPDQPLFIANMQTTAGGDTATVRSQNMSQTAIQIKVAEEQSKDSETAHVAEIVGYLIIGNATAE